MAEGLSVSLPVRIDEIDGAYALNKTYTQVATQNIKMVVLTSPGERIMTPEFGVGVRKYLFEPNTPATATSLKNRIYNQVAKYLPYITLLEVKVSNILDGNSLNIFIRYTIPAVNVTADLTIPVTS